jgi:hypothetical protein
MRSPKTIIMVHEKSTYLTHVLQLKTIPLPHHFQFYKYTDYTQYFQRGDLRFNILANPVVKIFSYQNNKRVPKSADRLERM